ncbi:cell division protein ZapE [Sandarakinorhabdus cyanobacteriorum]|uniref:Cell division protein ZapE n=1 Tax=Sandarakinorhabdus cyanobacteriorum TaxID=1981098 RepID=A0A255YI49_9SPHN|nr:cell division protein ZapE [Sandarakinorhabdus cyanobacteriorum]OYQ28858.1 cell division protein ZapE [Sandarakinorhabdus cyanobacteriorum]
MTDLLTRYDQLLAAGELKPDPAQAAVARRLAALEADLVCPAPAPGLLGRLFGKAAPVPPRGVYVWGGVGRGKSMLMDLFFAASAVSPKLRAHFHEFMADVHGRIHTAREAGETDPLISVANAIAAEARLLCFDEMQVKDIADAAILSRLFTALMERGTAIVTTSNRPPQDLYLNGLNRHLFLPFIDLIGQRMDVITLDGPTDYRLQRLGGGATWHVPNGPEATAACSAAFFRLTDYPPEDRAHVPSAELPVGGGRLLHVPKSLKGVAVFSFARLCRQPLGAADYLAIARHYHTLIIVGIPRLNPENRNEAIRFIHLIDALYERRVKLIAAADAEPADLYPAGDSSFEFERTVSRLMEMQSADYLALGHGG